MFKIVIILIAAMAGNPTPHAAVIHGKDSFKTKEACTTYIQKTVPDLVKAMDASMAPAKIVRVMGACLTDKQMKEFDKEMSKQDDPSQTEHAKPKVKGEESL